MGQKCSKTDVRDPKPSVDMNVGITVAKSQTCQSCVLTFDQANTSSGVTVTRKGGALRVTPFAPFTITFNGRQAVFTELAIFRPAPLRVEGVQADVVVQFIDGQNLILFVPLMKADGGSGPGFSFLSPITSRLDPATSTGLGVFKKDTSTYDTLDISTGQDWSITNLVDNSDPYFTWSNSELEEYVKMDTECTRWIGWRQKPGAQVIYFQNPVSVSRSDIDAINNTLSSVKPNDVLSPVMNPLYVAGKPKNCKPVLPQFKFPKTSEDKTTANFVLGFFMVVIVFLSIVIAVAFVNSDLMKSIGEGLLRVFSWRTVKKVAPSPAPAATGVSLPNIPKIPFKLGK
jgi:hypothetical protein